MKKKLYWVCCLPLLCLLMPTSLLGEDIEISADSHGHWLLNKYDLNGDQRITADEVSLKKLNIFRLMDTDEDGHVSLTEYKNMDAAKREALLKSRFYKLDSDQDGFITQAEYSKYMGLFESIDSDGNGELTLNEMGMDKDSSQAYVTSCIWRFCYRSNLDN